MTHRKTKFKLTKNTELYPCTKFYKQGNIREEKIAEIDKHFSDLKRIDYYPCSLPKKLNKCNFNSFTEEHFKSKESFQNLKYNKQINDKTTLEIENEKTKIGKLSQISSSNFKSIFYKSSFENLTESFTEKPYEASIITHRKVSSGEIIQEEFLEDLEEALNKLLVYMRKQGFTFRIFDCLYDPLVCTETFKNPFKIHIENLIDLNMIKGDNDKIKHYAFLALSPFFIGSLKSVGLSKDVFRKRNKIASHFIFDILSGCLCPVFTIIQIRNHLNEENLEEKIVKELMESLVTQHEYIKIERVLLLSNSVESYKICAAHSLCPVK